MRRDCAAKARVAGTGYGSVQSSQYAIPAMMQRLNCPRSGDVGKTNYLGIRSWTHPIAKISGQLANRGFQDHVTKRLKCYYLQTNFPRYAGALVSCAANCRNSLIRGYSSINPSDQIIPMTIGQLSEIGGNGLILPDFIGLRGDGLYVNASKVDPRKTFDSLSSGFILRQPISPTSTIRCF